MVKVFIVNQVWLYSGYYYFRSIVIVLMLDDNKVRFI